MKKIAKTILTALATLAFISFAAAQTTPEFTVLNSADSAVISEINGAPGYLHLSYSERELKVSLKRTQENGLSPLFQTFALQQGRASTGLRALHSSTSLTEVIGYYWNTLSDLGFSGTFDTFTQGTSAYTFRNGEGRLQAVFTQQGDDVTANLIWAQGDLTFAER